MKTRKWFGALLIAIAALGLFGVVNAQGEEESDCPAIMGGSIRGYVYGRAYDNGVPVPEGLEVIAVDDSGYVVGCGETLQYGVIPLMTVYQSGRFDPGVEFFVGGKFFFSDPIIGEWWGNMKELRLTLTTERPQGLPGVTVSLPTATVTTTYEITIPLTVSSTVSAKLFAGEVHFDSESLEFLDLEGGSILPRSSDIALNDILVKEGRLVFYGGGSDKFLLDGELLLLRFRGMEVGASHLRIESFVTDAPTQTELVDGGVTITAESAQSEDTFLYLPSVTTD
ncbi:hypothetical protein IPM65_02145 [Candidatus Roizmanbacteria bacterium]|nr:MAG: hypothetical protein IPM65_02145 [Candidatus Roizmanbacteria bacterium]